MLNQTFVFLHREFPYLTSYRKSASINPHFKGPVYMRECNDKSWPQFPSLTLRINSPGLSWQQLVVTRPQPRPIRGQYQRPVTNQRPRQQLVVGTLQHQPRSSLTGPGACLAVILHDKMVNRNYQS